MRRRIPVRTLAALAVLAAAGAASANPILLRGQLPALDETEGLLLVIIAVLVEWTILASMLRSHLRRPWRLVGIVVLAHVLSLPATAYTAVVVLQRGISGNVVAAEVVAVGIEFLVYAVALLGGSERGTMRPGLSGLRLLGVTCLANLASWLLGLVYLGARVPG